MSPFFSSSSPMRRARSEKRSRSERGERQAAQARKRSVQGQFMPVRQVQDHLLVLAESSGSLPEPYVYRSIIEVIGTEYTLRSEEEQITLIEGFRSLLKALTFPIQVLVKNQQLDLSRYLARLESVLADPLRGASEHEQAQHQKEDLLTRASRQTFMDRRFYIIIPAEESASLMVPFRPLSTRSTRQKARTKALDVARQQLDLRIETVKQLLTGMGLHCQVLKNEELMKLEYASFTPQKALNTPLRLEAVAAIDRPKRLKTREEKGQLSLPPEAERLPPPRWHPDQSSTAGTPPLPAPDFLRLMDFLSPSGIEEHAHWVCVEEDEYCGGIALTDFPREVTPGWFAPLVRHDDISDIVFHIHPQPSGPMLRRLLRKRTEIVSSKRLNLRQGRLVDPNVQIAEQDLEHTIAQLASGEEKVLEVGVYVLVRGTSRKALKERLDRMMALLDQLFVTARKTTFEQAKVFRSCLPHCRNELMRTMTLDTISLATAFPFVTSGAYMPNGVLEGTTKNGELVVIDDWDERFDNPHRFIGAVTGAGKSYHIKLKIMRELLLRKDEGLQVIVIDPEQEYKELCTMLGGDYIRLAPGSDYHINPFELLPKGMDFARYLADHSRGDRLSDKVQSLHTLLDLMLADHHSGEAAPMLSSKEKGLLDRAVYETYRKFGITADPRTHDLAVPLLRDLYDVLVSGMCGPDEYGLANRLYRFVAGSLAGPFSAQTNVALDNYLITFDVRDMSGELRPLALWLITDYLWSQVLSSVRPRVLYIDEAWSLIQYPEGGRFLADLARRARKRYLRLVTATQSPELFIANQWGSVIVSNAAIKLLKKQDRTSGEAVSKQFQLTPGEHQRLLTLPKQDALLMVGDNRFILEIQANPFEHDIATTDPRELEQRRLTERQAEERDSLQAVFTSSSHASLIPGGTE